MEKIVVHTKKSREVLDITPDVERSIKKHQLQQGLCHLFLFHTTAALSAADLDPGTDLDILDALEALIPKLNYRHPHDPQHVRDHILSTLIGPSLFFPVREGRPVLGTWQRIVLLEFSGPRAREIVISALPE